MELLSEKTDAHSNFVMSVAFSPDGTKIVSGSYDKTIKVWDVVNWSRKDHLMFNVTTQRFVLLLLWLNKHSMKFPDDVLDLLIEACLHVAKQVRRGDSRLMATPVPPSDLGIASLCCMPSAEDRIDRASKPVGSLGKAEPLRSGLGQHLVCTLATGKN